jgi:hypothetical protein
LSLANPKLTRAQMAASSNGNNAAIAKWLIGEKIGNCAAAQVRLNSQLARYVVAKFDLSAEAAAVVQEFRGRIHAAS